MPKDLIIANLKGGMNNTDPAHSLPDNQCVLAENIEFFSSTLGERRRGMEPVDLGDSGLDDEAVMVSLSTYQPKFAEIKDSWLWAISATEAVSSTIAYRNMGVWANPTLKDAINTNNPYIYQIQTTSIHGKWFVAYKSDEDRMHVWDGTTIRRAGIIEPTLAPTAVDEGAGAFTDDRIYRVRFIEKSGVKILRRSEPSPELTFTPSGAGAGATVTRPALVNEGETHWELEASDGDGDFYIIATIIIATTTYNDETIPATDYANNGVLSEEIGDYDLIPSVRFCTQDQDRVIFGGSWEDPEHDSRVYWTPVYAATGVGNDERIPLRTDNFIDLDWLDGGQLTGLSAPINGSFYAFKHNRIYKIQRTGKLDGAYESFLISPTRGAIIGSIVNGVDEYGRACVYFLDPQAGPARIGSGGLQYMQDLNQTWLHVNTSATKVIAHGVYYPDLRQVKWWVAYDGTNSPSFGIVSQITEIESKLDGTHCGWSVVTGGITEAWCSTIVPEIIEDEVGQPHLSFRPYGGYVAPNFIQRIDITNQDNGVDYKAKLVTRPYIATGLLNRWGAMTAALLAGPVDDPGTTLNVKFIRDFGKETNGIITDLVPENNEDTVIKVFDNLDMSSMKTLQIEISDT